MTYNVFGGTLNLTQSITLQNNAWRGGAIRRAPHLRIGRGFESCLGTIAQWPYAATYPCVPLSPSSITWYRSKGGDALRLGR